MKSLADALPPEIAQQVDPDWRKNEAAYWAVRDHLLRQYRDQWIGFADGAVIASGTSPVAVFHAAEAAGRSPFVTCVGREHEPVRMRRASFAYDGSYPGEPLPVLSLEFRPASGLPGVSLDRVIADTGADASALPWADCQVLQLTVSQGRPGWMGGVVGGTAPTVHFRVWVYLDGHEQPCRLQADLAHDQADTRDERPPLERAASHGLVEPPPTPPSRRTRTSTTLKQSASESSIPTVAVGRRRTLGFAPRSGHPILEQRAADSDG